LPAVADAGAAEPAAGELAGAAVPPHPAAARTAIIARPNTRPEADFMPFLPIAKVASVYHHPPPAVKQPNPEPGTRNPKPETRNSKLETRNPEPETRNPEPGTRNPEPGTRNPELETRNPEPRTPEPEPETRNPKLETRNSKLETRNPKLETRNPPNPDARLARQQEVCLSMAQHIPGKLHWEQHGKHGPTMLFIHGNPYDNRLWLYQTAHFSAWFRCVAVDLPAYGRSPAPQPGLTLGDLAQACWEAVDEVTHEPVILVGNSVGGSAIVYMAGQRPRQTRALIAVGSAYLPDRGFARMGGDGYRKNGIAQRQVQMANFISPGVRDSALTAYLQQMFLQTNDRVNAEGIVRIFEALEEPEPEHVYDAIGCPTLVVAGSEDRNFENIKALQRRIKNAELAVIEGGHHVPNLDYPAEFAGHVLAFLHRHDLFAEPRP
jgi:pimeloyl-ACP methyl ester carboxylesterase